MIVIGIFLNAFGFYTPFSGNYLQYHGKLGAAWEDICRGPFGILDGLDGDNYEDVRIDTSNLYFRGVRANSAMLFDVNSVSFYYSVINESTNAFLHDLWMPMPYENRYVDLDSRAMLSALLGVKYNIIKSGDEIYLPYGYYSKVQEKDNYALFASDISLPLAYLYDSVMSDQEYKALSPLQKQQALLRSAVVPESILTENDIDLQAVDNEKLELSNIVSEYEIEETVGLNISNNRIEVEEAGAFLTIKTESINKAERYFSFRNLWYEGKKNTYIAIMDESRSKSLEVKSSLDSAYADVHNFLCNLGFAEKHGDFYKVIFSEPGIYTYDSMEILSQPVEKMREWINLRKETAVEYSFGEDSVSTHLNSNKDELLFISIPYSSGWEARVDGDKAEIFKANNFGIGILVEQGEHTVELIYHTPYMRLGIGFMMLGIVFCIMISSIERSRRKT